MKRKRGLIIVLIIVAIVALIVVFINITQFTGKTTLTPNANYGPIRTHSEVYHSCVYLTQDDGWSVTKTNRIGYFDRLRGESKEVMDICETNTRLKEYDCQNGFMVDRIVICPLNMICKDGSCVSK